MKFTCPTKKGRRGGGERKREVLENELKSRRTEGSGGKSHEQTGKALMWVGVQEHSTGQEGNNENKRATVLKGGAGTGLLFLAARKD